MSKKAVIVTVDELKELLDAVRRLARVEAILGHLEDKEALYRFAKKFEHREKGERK